MGRERDSPHTSKLRLELAIPRLHLLDPPGHRFVGEGHVFLLPRLVVEARLGRRVGAVLAVLPHRVLGIPESVTAALFGRGCCERAANALEVVQSQHEIPGVREAVHDEETVGKEAPNVGEVEEDVAVGFIGRWFDDVCLHACDCGRRPPWLALVDRPLQAADV